MKLRLKIIALAVVVFGVVMVVLSPAAHAQEIRSSDNISVGKDETIDAPLIANGNTINIEGTVNGDLYCVGSQVIISGRVDGDIFCIAQSINLSGQVDGSARLLASDMNISGTIDGTLSALSSNFVLTDKAKITKDLMLATTNARINGNVGRDISLYSQSAELGGVVGRNVAGNIFNLTLSKNADIRGNVNYTSSNEPIRLSDSKVGGKITRNQSMPQAGGQVGLVNLLLGYLAFTLSLLIVSMLSVWAIPKFFVNTQKEIEGSIGKISLYGLANLFIVPVVCMVLAFTLVGLPLASLILLAWLLGLVLCGPVFAYYLGSKLLKNRKTVKNEYAVMFTGSIVILLLYLIPIVNFITGLVVGLVGSGAILAHFKHQNSRKK